MILGAELFFSLFNNLAIFIALVTVYGYLLGQLNESIWFKRQAILGLSFGAFTIGCMYAKIPVFEGVIVDQRNAIVVLSGAFGGPFSAFITAALAGSYRIYLGGSGVLAGVIGVCLSTTAGIVLNRFPGGFSSTQRAAASAFFATIVILPGFLFVKDFQTGWVLLKAMTLPYGLAIFCGIFLVGLLLNRQEERHSFELSFRESEKKYRELIEGTENLIIHTDKQGKFTFVNPVSGTVLGLTPAECIGMPAYPFIHPEDLDDTIERFNSSVAQKKKQMKMENRLINIKTGESRTVMWSFSFQFDGAGLLIGVGGIGHDVTERKRIEKELKDYREHLEELVKSRTAELESKNKELETFTYSVSHDLKAPLRGIDGYSRLLVDEYSDKLDKEGLLFLKNIRLSAAQMNQLIEDLLAYSRMERRQLQPVLVELLPMIDKMISQRTRDIEAGSINISVSLPFETITSDIETLRQVLGNYIDNAVKFSKKDTPATVEVGGSENETSWTLWVKDNGIGFDAQYHDRIFNIFQRLHRTEDYPGTGVGLAIARKAVERIGGRVWAKSEEGKGATFFITILKQ